MKLYKSLFKENSLSVLKDENIVQDIFDFFLKNPYPTDDDFHKFVESKGHEPDEYETYAYAILSCFMVGGKSKGKESDANDENKKIGDQIELEHVESDIENKVLKKIQQIISKKIRNDHLFENKNYYLNSLFKKELEKENK